MVKACWWCKHFGYSQAYPGYSKYTPGSDFEMYCYKNRWKFDPYETSQAEFGAMLASAEYCQEYE